MAQNVHFDTHAYVKRLTAVGVPEPQAEVQAEAIATLVHEDLATKQDLEALRLVLQRDLESLRLETQRDLREVELRLKHDMTLRFGAMMTAAVAIIVVLDKLL